MIMDPRFFTRATVCLLSLVTIVVGGETGGAGGAGGAGGTADATASPLRQENAALRAKIATLETQLTQLRNQLNQRQAQIDQLSVMAGVTPQGKRLASTDAFIQENHDDETDQIIVTTQTSPLRVITGSHANHRMHLQYTTPPHTTLTNTTTPPSPTNTRAITCVINAIYAGGIYRHVTTATLTVNEITLTLPVTDYDRQSKRTGSPKNKIRRDNENIQLQISATQLDQIVNTATLTTQPATLKLGRVKFQLTRDQVTAFRALAQHTPRTTHTTP